MLQIKSVFRCDERFKHQFSKSNCLLTISVGQETHENGRFLSTLALIERSFSACVIALHDSLQRHTIALSEQGEADSFHERAISVGDAWLERNGQYINKLRVPLKIIRWDQWMRDTKFLESKDRVLLELKRCFKYREVFSSTVEDYLSRYYRRLKHENLFDKERGQRLCMDYLIEECAVMCLWPNVGCQFEVYTGKHNAAMIETQKRFLSDEMLQSVAVGFNRRPNLKPQSFNFQKNIGSLVPIFSME